MEGFWLYSMAAVYIIAGIMHFVRPKPFEAIVPSYLPAPKALVFWSGIAEVLLGIGLLFSATRSIAVIGVILLLIAVFPANVYMATSDRFKKIPRWVVWGRLPIQGLLIYWAWQFI
jgi:uncharacterized membrane protein